MPRSRNIKPGICMNEELAELSCRHRFLFAVLPCFADREGRLEDRPLRIKMQVFPADNCDMDELLQDLHRTSMVQRYEVDNCKYIQIVNFVRHQNPHRDEKPSEIPPPPETSAETEQAPCKHSTNRADSLNLIPDSLKKNTTSTAARFDGFWDEYPKKVEKKKALAIWKRRKLDSIADTLIADIKRRKAEDRKWIEGYIPNPTTYLNGDRWEDELSTVKPVRLPSDFHQAWEILDVCGLPVGSDSREAQERMLNDHLASHPEDRPKVEAML